MSAPHTNIEKQKRRHRGPLIGMVVVVVFGVGLILYWILDEAAGGKSPTEPEPSVETAPAPQKDAPPASDSP